MQAVCKGGVRGGHAAPPASPAVMVACREAASQGSAGLGVPMKSGTQRSFSGCVLGRGALRWHLDRALSAASIAGGRRTHPWLPLPGRTVSQGPEGLTRAVATDHLAAGLCARRSSEGAGLGLPFAAPQSFPEVLVGHGLVITATSCTQPSTPLRVPFLPAAWPP